MIRIMAKLERSTALRYALAPACVGVAVLLHLSPIGPFVHPTGLFLAGIVAAAWFGGAGPGFLSALLATFALPQLIAMNYPLVAGFFDLPRFLAFGLTGVAVGWGTTFRRRAEEALRRSELELRQAHNELEMRVAQRTADLRFSEGRYARAMDASNDGLWEWNPITDELFVSPRAKQLLGVPDEVQIRKRTDLRAHGGFHPEDRRRIGDTFRGCLAPGSRGLDIEYRVIDPAGALRWVRVRGKVFPGSIGQPMLLTGSLTDITERKRAQAALSLSEERYARAMEAADEGHWEWNMVTDEMFLSQRMKEILGFAPDAQFGSRADLFARQPIHPDDRQRVNDARETSLSGATPRYAIEYRVIPRPGELRWVRSRGKVFRDEQGRPVRISGSFTDITDRKLADEALRRGEERFSLAVAGSTEGIWDWDIQSDEMFFSERTQTLYGLEPGMTTRKRAEWRRVVSLHPDDAENQSTAIEEYLAGRALAYDGEWRVRHADGNYRWVRIRGLCVRDDTGRATRMAGSVSDIDARKCTEEALRISEERYALAMEAARDGHWDWIVGTGEYYVSPRDLQLYGLPADTTFASRADFLARLPLVPEDRDAWLRAVADLFAGSGSRLSMELRANVMGETRWIQFSGVCVRDASGKPVRWSGTSRDVTDRKRGEEALRISEERFTLAVAGSNDGIWDWNVLTDEMFFSERAQTLYGLKPGVTIRPRAEWRRMIRLHPDDAESQLTAVEDYLTTRSPSYDGEWRVRHADDIYRWVRIRGLCVRDESGRATRIAGSVSDIDAQKCAEAALRSSEQRYALAVQAAGEGHWDWNVASDEFYADPRMLELYGFPSGTTFAGRSDFLARLPLHPEDRPKWEAAAAAHFAGISARIDMEIRILRRGETRWLHLTGLVSRDAAEKPLRWTGSVADITTRKCAEEALKLSEHRYALAMEATGDGHWDWNIPADKMYVSPLLLDMCGLPADITFASRAEWVERFPFYPGERPKYTQAVAEHFAGKTDRVDVEIRIVPRGETRWVHMTGRCSRDASGTPIRWAGAVTDVTARRRVDEELRARQDMLALAQKAARAVAFEWKIGAGEGENRWSPHLETMYGLAPGSYDGTYESWKTLVYPEDWPKVREAIKAAQESGDVAAEYRVQHNGGAIRWLQAKGRMFFDPDGKPTRLVGFMLDVTDRHLAEEELRQMEHQLRQAQRLEAMGTLAGGIAHDFNNLLGAILGYGEMAMRDAPAGSRLRRDLDSIMIAGERGRALVDRILAFSRSGVGERVAVHVEEVVRETLGLFGAKLPEGIALEDRLRAGRAAVMGDATQIHQVLMNLVTNAVQAMAAGGTLRVSLDCVNVHVPRVATTGTVAASDYIVLEIADTGSGIPPEVLERIFDPFFTTKEVGVGTGLGLSLVHGIVTGLGGVIDVMTTVGKGSVFTVYLPRAGDVTEMRKPKKRGHPETRRGDRERVLVVDDEESLVRLATETLTELDYTAVGFTASAAALDAFLADPKQFDAVITDESMPGLSGSELIRRVRQIRPTIPIMLVSGYLSADVVRRGREAGADEVLKKPLSARELAACLERLLHTANGRPEDFGVSAATDSIPKGRRRTAATRSAARPTRRR